MKTEFVVEGIGTYIVNDDLDGREKYLVYCVSGKIFHVEHCAACEFRHELDTWECDCGALAICKHIRNVPGCKHIRNVPGLE